jgi:ADP-glucose pyrophosphorylase
MPPIASIEVPSSEGRRFGIIRIDEEDRVIGFEEKPTTPVPGARRARCGACLDGHLHLPR